MNILRIFILAALLSLPLLLTAWANYSTVSTPSFEVYFRKGWEIEARNILQALEYSRPYVQKLTGHDPGKVPVVLADMGNMVNGYASPVGAKMGLFAYPPSGDELGLGEDWWQLVGAHEYIHMAQMTRTAGEPALLRALFGNLLYPNLYQPMWMTEGITVYGESQLSKYTGRLNAGSYPAIIGALAREGRLPNPGKACYYSYSNPLGNYYVYGSAFHQYLADKYGEGKFAVLYGETSSSLATYLNPITSSLSLDVAYQAAFGKDVATLWSEWQADAASKAAALPQQRLTKDGWEKDHLLYHSGALYYTARKVSKTGPSSTFSSHKLVRLDKLDAKPYATTLIEQNAEFTAGFQILGQKLYYSRGELKPGYANNDYDGLGVVTELWSADLEGGQREKLYSGPVRAFCPMDANRLLLAEDDETHQKTILSELSLPGGQKRQLGVLDCLIGTLHQQQGKIYATARGFWQNNSVYQLNLTGPQLQPLIDTPSLETVVAATGNDLIFNATYNGQNGCYSYNLGSRAIAQFSGFSEVKNAAPAPNGKTYFISINGDGYDIYADQLRAKSFTPPAERAAAAPYSRISSPGAAKVLNQYPVSKGSYAKNILHLLWPRLYRTPIISSNDIDETLDSLVVGFQLAGADVVGDFPLWTATVLYDLYTKDWGYQLGIENNFFQPVKQTLEYTDLGEKTLSAVQYVPLLQKLNYGLTAVNAGFGIQSGENLTRTLVYPFLGLNFTGRGLRLQTSNSLMWESKDFHSDRDRLGWQGRFNLRLKAPLSTELRSSVLAAWDPDAETDEVFSTMRGYEKIWPENSGVVFSNSWYAPILKIRDGLWNPNVYIEDVNLGFFYDYAFPWGENKGNLSSAYGIEAIAEIFAFYNYNFNLGVRFSWNREGQALTQLILDL